MTACSCRYCGCGGDSCTLPNGDKCSLNEQTGLCNAPGCVRAELARQRAIKPVRSRYAGWGYGAILEDLRKRRRGRRRKKAA